MNRQRIPSRLGPFGPLNQSDRPPVQYNEMFYVEPVNFLALAGATQAVQNVLVQADSAFKLSKLTFQADIALATLTDATNVVPLCTIQIIDSGSGRNLFGGPVSLPTIFGRGSLPFILPVPYIFMPRSNINLTVANLTAATTYNLRLSLVGSKIFEQGNP